MLNLDIVSDQYRVLAWVLLAALIASGGGLAGWKLCDRYLSPKLEAAQKDKAEFAAAYKVLASSTQRQNAAIVQLNNDIQARREKAAQSVVVAKQWQAGRERAAREILGIKPPPGKDECQAAREAFDDELRQERGK